MGHILHHQGLNVDEEMLRGERAEDGALPRQEPPALRESPIRDPGRERGLP